MIIINQTPITETSFDKWKSHKIDVDEKDDTYYYYVLPLVDIKDFDKENLETTPAFFSSYSDEFTDDKGNTVYTVRFDTQLPDMTTEQEVELAYTILTKKSLLK
jgi:hypothetical protein